MPATATVTRRREELTEFEPHHDYATVHQRLAHEAPGQEHLAHYHGAAEGAPSSRARFAGAHRHAANEEELLRRILEDEPATLSTEEVVAEASRARRRARAPHRQFRLTTTQLIIAGTLLCQLTGILWLQSQALALRNRDQELQAKIRLTGQQIAQTKNAIAQLDSESNLTHLAAQMGWTAAPVSSLDDVSKKNRVTQEEAAALGMATPEGERKAKMVSESRPASVAKKPVVEIANDSSENLPPVGLVPLDRNLMNSDDAERPAGEED